MIIYRVNSSKVAYQTIDNETIIIDFETGAYYSIEGIGSLIWEAIAKGATPHQIIAFFVQHYKGQEDEIRNSVIRFIEDLEQETLFQAYEENHPFEGDIASLLSPLSEQVSFIPPSFEKYTDMQDLLLLDPIHEVDEEGWPIRQQKSSD